MITTVAGSGESGFGGDGGPATAALLDFPSGVAVDGAGNLFIADARNDRIRKVDAAGMITTVAGSEVRGFGGDGGPATAALLDFPQRRGAGRRRQPLHRRHAQRPDPEGGRGGDDHDRGGLGRVRVRRGRGSGNRGSAGFPQRRGGGRRWQSLHRRRAQRPDPEGGRGGDDHDRGGLGSARVRRGRGSGNRGSAGFSPAAWRWTAPATSSSPTRATTGSGRWTRRG